MLKRLALTLLLIAPSFAWSQKFFPDITLDKIGNIEVVIRDSAVDGCWTNIKEVKNYAEGKLEIAGAKLFEPDNDLYLAGINNGFYIKVNAMRMDNGICFGNVSVFIGGLAMVRDILGIVKYSSTDAIAGDPKNLNISILNHVQTAINEWTVK